jgi:DNA-binding MurR/RpiR family transcriptional regulator
MSYSGTTEETLSALKDAEEKGARVIVITVGGKLQQIAEEKKYPLALLSEETISIISPSLNSSLVSTITPAIIFPKISLKANPIPNEIPPRISAKSNPSTSNPISNEKINKT